MNFENIRSPDGHQFRCVFGPLKGNRTLGDAEQRESVNCAPDCHTTFFLLNIVNGSREESSYGNSRKNS